ncbi:periplasmic heavy metal sensor [Actibacterium sp.]|uniref:periplasmic heavy metal sensor n=1 Tax=Actibacterium sp. TaxID=1872125 RepID=UPI00356252BF
MSTQDQQPDKKTPFRWSRVVLALSLALNLLVVGTVAGVVVRHERPHPEAREPGSDLLAYGPYGFAFDDDDRDHMRQMLRHEVGQLRENRRAVRRDFDQVVAALRATPYDPALVQNLIEQQQARVNAQADHVRDLMLAQIAAMDDEEREEFADRLEALLRRGPPPRHHDYDRD